MIEEEPTAGQEQIDTTVPRRQLSADDALADVLPSASDLEDAEEGDDASENEETASVPIICRIKSGARICEELGFESTVNAACDRADADGHVLVPISRRSMSERSLRSEPDMLGPSRLPSLRRLAPGLAG